MGEGVQHLRPPAVLPVYLEALGFLIVAVSLQQPGPFKDVGVVPALFHLLAGSNLPMTLLPGDAFSLLVFYATAAYPSFVPAVEKLAADLLVIGIDREAVVVACEEDCPLGSGAVCLDDVVGLFRHDACIDELRHVVARSSSRRIGCRDVEVAGQQRSVELEGVAVGRTRLETCQFLHATRYSRTTHKKARLGESH